MKLLLFLSRMLRVLALSAAAHRSAKAENGLAVVGAAARAARAGRHERDLDDVAAFEQVREHARHERFRDAEVPGEVAQRNAGSLADQAADVKHRSHDQSSEK